MNLKYTIEKPCYGRFKGLSWFDTLQSSNIFVGGAGGIGSHLAFQLIRTGAKVFIVDDDTVGEENLAGQLYGKDHVGTPKVGAIRNVVDILCDEPYNLSMVKELVTEEEGQWHNFIPRADVVCVGFDNLKARKLIYDYWKEHGKEESLFVDGRLAAESGQVYVVPKKSHEDIFLGYEATYFPDSERIELPCTMKSTTHCGAMIAGFMVGQIANWCNNITPGTMPRELCNIEFHLPLMMVETSHFKVKTYVEELE